MAGGTRSFLIRSTYDVLPNPENKSNWYNDELTYSLRKEIGTSKNFLVGFKTSLTKGKYTWRHKQVLRKVAVIMER